MDLSFLKFESNATIYCQVGIAVIFNPRIYGHPMFLLPGIALSLQLFITLLPWDIGTSFVTTGTTSHGGVHLSDCHLGNRARVMSSPNALGTPRLCSTPQFQLFECRSAFRWLTSSLCRSAIPWYFCSLQPWYHVLSLFSAFGTYASQSSQMFDLPGRPFPDYTSSHRVVRPHNYAWSCMASMGCRDICHHSNNIPWSCTLRDLRLRHTVSPINSQYLVSGDADVI